MAAWVVWAAWAEAAADSTLVEPTSPAEPRTLASSLDSAPPRSISGRNAWRRYMPPRALPPPHNVSPTAA